MLGNKERGRRLKMTVKMQFMFSMRVNAITEAISIKTIKVTTKIGVL